MVQLGAYLGKTTLFIAERAPRALIFVIDPWDNAVLKAEPSLNKNFANIDLFDRVPFYPTFLRNTWHLAARRQPEEGDRLVGVVPLRMSFEDGLTLLKTELGLRPDVLYWEGFPKEAGLLQTLGAVKEAFPGVVVVGDGYNYPEVQAGLARASKDLYQDRKPFVEMGKCWTFLRLKMDMLSELRAKYTATDNRAERTVLASKEVAGASFKDLLSGLKSKSRQLKDDEAEERAKRRREEEEERDRIHREREAEEERQRRRQEGREEREREKQLKEGEVGEKDDGEQQEREKEGRGVQEYRGRGRGRGGRGAGRGRGRGRGRGGGQEHESGEGRGRERHERRSRSRSRSRSRERRRSRSAERRSTERTSTSPMATGGGVGGGSAAVEPKRQRQEMEEEESEDEGRRRWNKRRRGEVDESEDDERRSHASADEEDEDGRGWV